LEKQPAEKQLRSFGVIMSVFFVAVGVYPALRHAASPRIWALALAAAFALPAIAWPRILRRPYLLWMALGRTVGTWNARLLLAVTYFLLFTPAAFIIRLAGKDLLRLRFESHRQSYRIPRQARPASHMEHQF
jgi:hypothetical protein